MCVSMMRSLDVKVSQVVDRVVLESYPKQLCDPLSSEPLLLTHEHELDGEWRDGQPRRRLMHRTPGPSRGGTGTSGSLSLPSREGS
jgi:hypothetical protein